MYIAKKPVLWKNIGIFIWSASIAITTIWVLLSGTPALGGAPMVLFELSVACIFVVFSACGIVRYKSRKRRYEIYEDDAKQLLALKHEVIEQIDGLLASNDVDVDAEYTLKDDVRTYVVVHRIRHTYMCMISSCEGVAYNRKTMRDDSVEVVRFYTLSAKIEDEFVQIAYDAARVSEPRGDDDESETVWFVRKEDPSRSHKAMNTASAVELHELLDYLTRAA